jgi:hypothetical protein
LQHAKALVGEEHSLRFADAVNFYPATAQDARQLLPILDQIGDMPLGAITGALLKSLGRKLKPNACTDTWWREIVTPARAVINHAHEHKGSIRPVSARFQAFSGCQFQGMSSSMRLIL